MINESEECEKQLFEEKISIINKKRDTLLLQLKELKKLQRQILDEYNKLSDSKKN